MDRRTSSGSGTSVDHDVDKRRVSSSGNVVKGDELAKDRGHFLLSVTGQIASVHMPNVSELYCKYFWSCGPEWVQTAGLEEGVSQITAKGPEGQFVWNFPLEVTFKSSSPHGWPQLVVSVFGSDNFGYHVVKGYGVTHVPLSAGSFTKTLGLFVPESSSFLQRLSAWVLARPPEFVDPKVLTQNEGRQVVRVQSSGQLTVQFSVLLKDFRQLDFVSSTSQPSKLDY